MTLLAGTCFVWNLNSLDRPASVFQVLESKTCTTTAQQHWFLTEHFITVLGKVGGREDGEELESEKKFKKKSQ